MVFYNSFFSHRFHVNVHALLLNSLASLEPFNNVDKVFRSAAAILLNQLQSCLKQTVGHFVSESKLTSVLLL